MHERVWTTWRLFIGAALLLALEWVVDAQVWRSPERFRRWCAGSAVIRFGHNVPWCRAFPYSVLAHPQYVGSVLSIWGLFLMTRFPQPDWYLLPTVESAYDGLAALIEQRS